MNSDSTVEITVYASVKDNTGSVARTVWPTFVDRTTTHKEGPKAGKLICGALFSGTRAQKNVLTRTCYLLDIEPNKATGEVPPDADQVRAAMALRGWAGVIYSTHSHTQEAPRYRVALPPETAIDINRDPAALAEDGIRALGLAAALGLGGVVDGTKLSAESMFYLPTHAPDAPHFGVSVAGRAITADELAQALVAGKRLRADDDQYQAAAQEQRPARTDGVIAAYNASATVAELLERHGYRRRPRSTVDWRSRYQTSEDSFATRVIDARWVTLSASDIAAGIGRRSASGVAASGDAFDLYCHYEHRGDQRAAMRAAAKALGLDAKKPRDEWHDAAGGADADGESESGPAKKPVLMPAADFLARYVPADYIVDGLLLRGAMYSLTAPTGTGKTAVALMLMQCVAAGAAFSERAVDPGAVLYCAGENPDDLRHRMIAAADNAFGGLALDRMHVYEPSGPQSLLQRVAEIKAYAERIGGLRLVIVDTAAAFFDGDNENDNTQAGNYARELRAALCNLSGRPAVIVLAHPIKRPANAADCLPRGGGAFIAEVDGNLTLWGQDGEIALHWAGKFRGAEFAAIPLTLESVETSSVMDAKGRPVKTVIAREGRPGAAEDKEGRRQREIEQIMTTLARIGRARGPLQLGQAAGLLEIGGNKDAQRGPYQVVFRHIEKLKADGLMSEAGGLLEITAKGRKWVRHLSDPGAKNDQF